MGRGLVWLLPILMVAAACGKFASSPPTEPAVAGPTYRNHGPEATYVGIEVCGQCHVQQYEAFSQSQMGRSYKKASLSKSVADFASPDPIYNPHRDLYYQPFHRGEDLFVKEYRLVDGDTVHRRVEQIDLIVGSGQHTNSHIREINGYLYQIPVTWYAQDGRWDLAPGFDDESSHRFNRAIELECMACHNATPTFVEGSLNRFAEVPHGIDCERCHGPGSVHVEEKLNGQIVDTAKAIDYSIVNPAKLSLDLQYDVCRRCHMQAISVYKEGKSPLDFRPGMKLSDVTDVFWPRFTDSTRQFLMASHPDRLQMSACFQATREEASPFEPMTCVTCHDPHVDVTSIPDERFTAQCQSCHTTDHAPVCAEESVVMDSPDANCVQCHMPTSGTMDIPHVRVTDHNIRVVEQHVAPEDVERQREFVRLASLVNDHPSDWAVGVGYLNFVEQFSGHPRFLDSAAVYLERARAQRSERALSGPMIRLAFLRHDYAAVRKQARSLPASDVGDAWTAYRIGQAHADGGALPQALSYYERAVTLAPHHLDMQRKLADAYASSGRLQRALATYDDVLAADSTLDETYNNRGLLQVQLGDVLGAEVDFKRAIALNPDAEQAMANLASLYYNTARPGEARRLAERLVRLKPENAQYRRFLAMLE